MATTTIRFDKESRVLAQFERTLRNASRSTLPTLIEREMELTRKAAAAHAARKQNQKPAERISFHNPDNPLNGFKRKSRVEQMEILAKLKEIEKAKKKGQ